MTTHAAVTHMGTRRFRVAFSFAGEKRDFVSQVATILADRFGEEQILYDKYHEAEFARRDLGIYLPDLYHKQSDLVVVVICKDYERKEWSGLELIAIPALIKERKAGDVMLCRFDRALFKSFYSTAGFVELDQKSPEETAKLIIARLAANDIDITKRGKTATLDSDSPTDDSVRSDSKEKPLVFISASNNDSEWRTFFERRLDQYKEDIEWWDDSKLEPGMAWEDEVDSARSRASIAVLLLSQDYLNSRNAMAEMAILTARAKSKGGLRLFPIVVHDCDWHSVAEIRSVQIWDKGRPLDRFTDDRKALSLEIQKIATNILKLIGKEPPSEPIDDVDPDNVPTITVAGTFSPNAKLIVDKALSLMRESGRNRVTSSCLLFAFTESEVSRNNPVVQDIRNSREYSKAFKIFLTAPDVIASTEVETLVGMASKNVASVIRYAEKVAFLVSSAKTIHQRHLLAALLNPPGLKGKLGAHKRLKAMGIERSSYLAGLLKFILSSEQDDDRVEWKSVLAIGPKPVQKREAAPNFQEGPAGYTAEFCGVGGERAVADYLFVGTHADRLAELIALRETKLPLAIGLFGNWGSGKSHFMNLMDRRLKALMEIEKQRSPTAPPKWCQEIVPIYFNAWHYLDANLWASLVAQIFESLFSHLRPKSDDLAEVQKLLEEASGATARAAEEVGLAQAATEQARIDLQVAKENRLREETMVDALLHGLRQLLPQVKSDELQRQVADVLGVSKEIETLGDLRQVSREARTVGSRVKRSWNNLFKEPGRTWRITWLVMALIVVPALSILAVTYLPVLKDWFAGVGRGIPGLLTGLPALIVWLRSIFKKGNEQLDQIDVWISQAKAAQDRARDTPQVVEATMNVTAATAREEAARSRLANAEAREQQLLEEAKGLHPERRLGRYIEQRAQSSDYRGQLGLVSLARRDFQELSNLFADAEALEKKIAGLRASTEPTEKEKADKIEELSRSIDRIVLFVDDLDRCQPEKIVEILQAVHLLLAFPLFTVVVGVDQRALRQSLRMQFKGLLTQEEGKGVKNENLLLATPLDYLEKIFHVPFHLPAMGETGFGTLIDRLTEPKAEKDATSGEPDQRSDDTKDPTTRVSAVQKVETTSPGETAQGAGASAPVVADKIDQEQIQAVIPASAEAPAAHVTPVELVGSVPLQDWERKALRHYHSLIQTPRGATRLLNTYRLVRAGVPKQDWESFSGGEYRMAMLLLAAAAGYPATAREWFRKLLANDAGQLLAEGNDEPQTPGWDNFKRMYHDEFAKDGENITKDVITKWIERVETFTF